MINDDVFVYDAKSWASWHSFKVDLYAFIARKTTEQNGFKENSVKNLKY